ncbi:nucleotidyltransferase family protein [Cryobacterium tagatosivorans]|uniref:Nucleotidyltransferase family protein n=1 Tax=Cryobacterium tagatosivorans TaxID=1259199 RepID=A0A4R8UC98_9MICO|nr:NTP transferase domain-containing protein [Cryobacterium tagatosivorans]TFB46781.1 nucleotidyltransferase family protein [Cryobacterium tagatosivorans]
MDSALPPSAPAPVARPPVAGLLLAAGAGSRHGSPKALRRGKDGEPWLLRAINALQTGGCSPVIVVLGARGDEAELLLPGRGDSPERAGDLVVVHAADWATGVSASLRAGLAAAAALEPAPAAVAVVPVDVPDLDGAIVARLIGDRPDDGQPGPVAPDTLRQASFDGRPGHPVVIGRGHWAALGTRLAGDRGARRYLVEHGVRMIDCGDLGTGVDDDD